MITSSVFFASAELNTPRPKLLQFQFFDTRLPETDNKGPGEGESQQRNQSAQAFRALKSRVFKVEDARFQRSKKCFDARRASHSSSIHLTEPCRESYSSNIISG